MKASTCLNIVFIQSDIVETCSSSSIVFPMMSLCAKALGTTPKTWLHPKKAIIDTPPPLTQGCLPHTLNESFARLVHDQDNLLILKSLFLSQNWIDRKHKYFLCDDLRNLSFLHTSIFDECMGWVEMKGRKRRIYRWEIENAIIPQKCRPTRVSHTLFLSLFIYLFIYFEKACVCTSSCDWGSPLPLVLHLKMA